MEFEIRHLGPRAVPSPLGLSTVLGDSIADFTPDDERVVYDLSGRDPGPRFERAGPREQIRFHGPHATAGIVTCGGLCPGMNDVIRGLVIQLRRYGVPRILGFRYGYWGLTREPPAEPLELTRAFVDPIHLQGGTVLGSSRGHQDPAEMVDTLQRLGVDLLFPVGGDGTMRGALAIAEEVRRRGAEIAVVGVPKTIDNDLPFIEKTFGLETAVSIASEAIRAAWVEACGAPNGLGLVKLMGRHAGFIAAGATQASGQVDLTLVPELPFDLHGEHGVLAWMRRRILEQGHVVVVVAEGAGQRHLAELGGVDASGNPKLGDVGLFLRDTAKRELADLGVNVKYIDPSYIIRAAPANPADAIFCGQLAEDAVHASMAGKTDLVVGLWGGRFTHVPLEAVTSTSKRLSIDGPIWRNVVERTGQPFLLGG